MTKRQQLVLAELMDRYIQLIDKGFELEDALWENKICKQKTAEQLLQKLNEARQTTITN